VDEIPSQVGQAETVEFRLHGDLTVKQATHAITRDMAASLKGEVLSGQARTLILMADFGIQPPGRDPDGQGWSHARRHCVRLPVE
jgi:hypothetical protein